MAGNENLIKVKGVTSEYKDDRGGGNIIPSAVLGIVKNNVDPTRCGKIQVYLKRAGSAKNPDDPGSWTDVKYLSPFFGSTPNTGNPDAYGDFVGNPNSYGFWATPPDVGTEVICVFLNGDPSDGYYIGSIPQPGMTHMTPGIAASDSIIPNAGEAQSYGGAPRLPVSEINNANSKQNNNPSLTAQPRPIHSYQAAIYNKQGLLRDPDRGPISSSSTRESPSRVFGMSTPGRPIFQGGYNDSTIAQAVADPSIPDKNFQIIGRTGGHTFVMDDGDLVGKDQLVRLRTTTGHTILMSDSAQTLFIIHANGQSYIEMGKEGTIDMYSTNSVNIRTQGDLNLHADRNINMYAAKDLNINAQNIQVESEKATNMYSGTTFAQHVKGNYTNKVDGAMSLASAGDASMASSGQAFVNGSKVNLNTGSASLKPQAVKQVPKIKHTDTLYDGKVGFAAAPGTLESITSRAPAHTPWADANKGTDAKTNLSSDANFPAPAAPKIEQVNSAVPSAPTNPVTPALVKTVTNVPAASSTLNKNETAAIASSIATNAASNEKTAPVTQQGAGTVPTNQGPTAALGQYALTAKQLEVSGYLKPGSSVAIDLAVSQGKPLNESIPTNTWTGKDGVNSIEGFIKNSSAQSNAVSTLIGKSEGALVDKGIISGNESATKTGGLIMATASAGIGPVSNFVKTATGTVSSVAGAVTSKLPDGVLNSTTGSVEGLISSGKQATNLLDKSMGGLSSPATTDSPQGVAKGLFDKITSGFKALKAGIPQNLTSINAKNKAEQEAADAAQPEPTASESAKASEESKATSVNKASIEILPTLDKAFKAVAANNIPGVNLGGISTLANAGASVYDLAKKTGEKLASTTPSGVDNLPGGASSISNNVQGNVPTSIPGTSDIKGVLSKVSTSVSGAISSVSGTVSGLKDKVLNTGSLASLAGTGLSSNDLAKLQGAISSVSAGGPAEVKLPTTAEGTNDVGGLMAQSNAVLGNKLIPSLNFGSIKPRALSPAESAQYTSLTEEKEKLTDKGWDLQKAYRDAKLKYGSTSIEAEEAYAAYTANQAEIDSITQKLTNLALGSNSSTTTT